MQIGNCTVKSKQSINILGVKFDANLRLNEHIEHAIKESNKVLHAIRTIKNYLSLEERKDLLTSLFFCKTLLWIRDLALANSVSYTTKMTQKIVSKCLKTLY
jgi:hypothetical protein